MRRHTLGIMLGVCCQLVFLSGCFFGWHGHEHEEHHEEEPEHHERPERRDDRRHSELLNIGKTAPGFAAIDARGERVNLADYAGKKNVALIFYVKDNTPGCTRQLCAVRDNYSGFVGKDVEVLGVNPDDAKSHEEFAAENRLPFPLVVDKEMTIAKAYGCEGENGRVERTVYGIDKEGRIVFAERGSPKPEEILGAFEMND